MTEERCMYSLDGEHHYGNRHYLARFKDGRPGDPNEPDSWYWSIACRCGKRPPQGDEAVRAQLRETARERARQRELARRLTGQIRMETNDAPRLL